MIRRNRSSLEEDASTVQSGEKRDRVGRVGAGNKLGRGHGRPHNPWRASLQAAVTDEDWRAVVRKAIACARTGDRHARAWLSELLIGRPRTADREPSPVALKITTPAEVLEAHRRIHEELGKGRIGTEEAESLGRLVDQARLAIETLDLEERVRALEERRDGQT
jgi:hypothetical protein